MELLQKRLKEAVETYWTLREAVDELNPFSSYDQELLGPELHADPGRRLSGCYRRRRTACRDSGCLMAEDWAKARRGTWLTAALRRIGRYARGETFGLAVRAFCVAMWLIVLVAAGAAFNQISSVHASVDCKHRGYAHIDHHGGKLEDDRYHLMHHEKVSCDHDKHEGKADEAEHEAHDIEHAEHDLKHLEPHEHARGSEIPDAPGHHSVIPHHSDKLPHEHHHHF